MDQGEIHALQSYLQRRLNASIEVRTRPRDSNSLEVFLDGEFIGTCYRDSDEGEISYHLTISVLADDIT